jgi:hypothetical protein
MSKSSLLSSPSKAALWMNVPVLLLGIIIVILLATIFNVVDEDGSALAPLGIILGIVVMTPAAVSSWIIVKIKKASRSLSIGAIAYGGLAVEYEISWLYMMGTA